MKPHVMRKSEFLADKGITSYNNSGIFVVRDGNKYQFAVELDVDTVVFVDETEDKEKIPMMINNLLYEIGEIRERFDQCFPEL
ncbi:hypothetical protein [Tepidibacillus fermentans]|uniref:Uncharacterized protein n=1 Tax=Tepidibacillus fermentans TaxID=1281767 RepID=A0A4R3KI85_9BACI|nr:hypothetical protein [Tepidibacillus fermentans]TCS83217.1 hypothetical protein EDD72_106146 [Tepidibacillus fermentans]